MAFFSRDHFRMHYEIHDGAVPEDTLFIHGNLGANLWWEPTLAELGRLGKGKGWRGRALLAEWRGSGASSPAKTEAELAPKNLARDYLALLAELQFCNFHLVGHSLGGMIVQELLLQAPEKFARAVILNPLPATGYVTNEKKFALIDRMRADRKVCRDVMATTIVNVHTLPAEYFERVTDAAYRAGDLNWRGIPNQVMRLDIRESLKRVANPLLVIHGLLDYVVPEASSREIAELVENGSFMRVERAGHSMNVEDPTGFVELVSRFLWR